MEQEEVQFTGTVITRDRIKKKVALALLRFVKPLVNSGLTDEMIHKMILESGRFQAAHGAVTLRHTQIMMRHVENGTKPYATKGNKVKKYQKRRAYKTAARSVLSSPEVKTAAPLSVFSKVELTDLIIAAASYEKFEGPVRTQLLTKLSFALQGA